MYLQFQLAMIKTFHHIGTGFKISAVQDYQFHNHAQ